MFRLIALCSIVAVIAYSYFGSKFNFTGDLTSSSITGGSQASVVFPSNLNKATHLAMTLTEFNEESVKDSYIALSKINKKRKSEDEIIFIVIIPETFQPIYELDEVGTPAKKILSIKAELISTLSLTELPNWEEVQSNYLQYSWLQDIGQPFWVKKEDSGSYTRAFLDLNKPLEDNHPTTKWTILNDEITTQDLPLEQSDFSLLALKDFFSWKNFRMENIKRSFNPDLMGNHGGNLEVLPNNKAYVGNTAPVEMIDLVEKLSGQAPLILDTSFLIVGHVDEILSIVPAKNSCGFGVVAADPLEGLLIRSKSSDNSSSSVNSNDTLLKSITYFANGKNPNEVDSFQLDKKLRQYSEGYEKGYPYFSDWITYKSIKAKQVIENNLTKLSNELRKFCPSFKSEKMIARVPVSAAYGTELDYFQADPDLDAKGFIHFSTPTTNLVVLDDHLLIANFTNEIADISAQYKKITEQRLSTLGYLDDNLHFVDASAYHVGMGSIHCGTLTFRDYK